MKKYKNKHTYEVFEAIQLKKETVQECYDFIGAKGDYSEDRMGLDPVDGQFKITTSLGVYTIKLSDWIVKDYHGKLESCKSDVFYEKYKPI